MIHTHLPPRATVVITIMELSILIQKKAVEIHNANDAIQPHILHEWAEVSTYTDLGIYGYDWILRGNPHIFN